MNLPSDLECVYTFKVIRNTTNTKVFLNYHAICPCMSKISLINYFLERAFNVYSNLSLFNQNINLCININIYIIYIHIYYIYIHKY